MSTACDCKQLEKKFVTRAEQEFETMHIIQYVGEVYMKLDRKIDETCEKLDRKIDQKFGILDARIDKMEKNFDQVNRRLESLENTMTLLISIINEIRGQYTEIKQLLLTKL
jgi:predicted RNase H-like nuclease (RuvC/YqgF family)